VRRRFYRGKVARPKAGKTRSLGLSRPLAEALRSLQVGRGDDDLVWTTPTGKRIGDSVLMARVLKPAAVEAGLGRWIERLDGTRRAESWVGFHTFRHTCATRLIVEDGWSLEQVQVYLSDTAT
jgi:integrase